MSINMPLQEAIECLTVGEIGGVEKHFGKSMDGGGLSATDLMAGVVWAYERRNDLKGTSGKRTDWHDIDGWTLRQLKDYFADEEMEVDDHQPEGEQGKDDSLAA